jgi:hypothetical protein
MGIILWLMGTTRTISSILVTVDGTFICGGIIVMFLAIDAGSEDNAFSILTKIVINLAYPVRAVFAPLRRTVSTTRQSVRLDVSCVVDTADWHLHVHQRFPVHDRQAPGFGKPTRYF